MRVARDVLIAVVAALIVALIVASTSPKHLITILWFALGTAVIVLLLILFVDWKQDAIKGVFAGLTHYSPVAWRGFPGSAKRAT